MSGERTARVLIAGGGVAGMEALLALRDIAGDRAELTLLDAGTDFIYKPLLVEEPFGLDLAEQHALEPAVSELGATFVQGALSRVRPEDRRVDLADASSLPYDYLVVCLGGRPAPAYHGVTSFPDMRHPLDAERLLGRAHSRAGDRIAFVVPPGVTWALPLYELALMTERHARERNYRDLEIEIVTPEPGPLAVFGPVASEAVAEMLKARGIKLTPGTRVHEEDGELVLSPGDRQLERAEVVALKTMEGPGIEGLPSDPDGFIRIDEHCRAFGLDDVYAAGDGTNFPVKQGGIATQQADAAATDIAHRLGAAVQPEPFKPTLRGKLLTGGESLHMRAALGGGEGEGEVSPDTLWWPPHKISGRYLAPWLYNEEGPGEPSSPEHGLDVEVALPREWHLEPMATDTDGAPRVE
ncbi:MAG: NAD(P)/FAD-dependent oxidoreductase [Solirubrobacterales bacterium]